MRSDTSVRQAWLHRHCGSFHVGHGCFPYGARMRIVERVDQSLSRPCEVLNLAGSIGNRARCPKGDVLKRRAPVRQPVRRARVRRLDSPLQSPPSEMRPTPSRFDRALCASPLRPVRAASRRTRPARRRAPVRWVRAQHRFAGRARRAPRHAHHERRAPRHRVAGTRRRGKQPAGAGFHAAQDPRPQRLVTDPLLAAASRSGSVRGLQRKAQHCGKQSVHARFAIRRSVFRRRAKRRFAIAYMQCSGPGKLPSFTACTNAATAASILLLPVMKLRTKRIGLPG